VSREECREDCVRGFGELEAVVMDRVWSREATSTVREVFDDLRQQREIAYTTVMSTMDNLYRKGWLARERNGKAYRYWPTLTREQYGARLMREALDSAGNPDVVLTHFLDQISEHDSVRLQHLLQRWAAGRDAP
jgi:predicted transcriptional regulator